MLNLMTLANIKIQLGLSDSTYDAAITAILPIVSSDVRRILNNGFDKYVLAVYTLGDDTLDLGIASQIYDQTPTYLKLGQVVYGTGIPADTYLTDFNPLTGIYTMSANATADGDYIVPTLQIAQFPTFSKMCWYRISTKTTSDAEKANLKSYSYGPVSKTYSDSEINKKWNYPQTLITDLGKPYAKVV